MNHKPACQRGDEFRSEVEELFSVGQGEPK
jgi:hypothetical protein